MTTEFIPYKQEHLLLLDLLPTQEAWMAQAVSSGYAKSAEVPDFSWTGICEGRVIGCGGLVEMWPGRAVAWMMFSQNIPRQAWVAIIGKTRSIMRRGPKRIEATIKEGFGNGCRWADLLGFKVEGIMKAYGVEGADYFMYSQVKADG